ncbi:MAG: hypothetical protein H6742_02695 [Alphaproteobacteria bacterium]|nr:hypothetical protein [Alphaproteobacteria bacterium]
MRFRTLTSVLAVSAVVFTFGANDAFAKKEKKAKEDGDAPALIQIELVDIAEADAVFGPAKEIHDILNDIETNLGTARGEFTTALGVAQDAPLQTALDDLMAKAGDSLTVAIDGGKPKLSVGDAAPDNVKTAVEAGNKFIQLHVDSVKRATELVPKAQEVAAAAAGLDPAGLAQQAAANPMEIPKKVKAITNNVKAITQTPKRIESLVGTLNENITVISGLAK